MKTSITAVGDAMLLNRFPVNYSLAEIGDFIMRGEARAVNVEMVLSQNAKLCASTYCGGQWICSNPANFDELQKYGFNLFGCANNHSMDYSYEGLMETCSCLKDRNVAFAGIGDSLKAASSPAYYKKILANGGAGKKYKFAMVSFTTTFIDAARAGNKNLYFSARPGVNAVRHKDIYYVSEEKMNVLKEIAEETCINGERDNARKIGSLPPEEEGSFNFGGIFFQESDQKGKMSDTNRADEKRILASILEASENAEYVIVLAHSHQIKHSSYTEPDYFFEDLCRKCIEAGAACVIGGGTHQLKPVEIYQGKPIFYSLGNFIFQLEQIDRLPDDFWDKYHYDRSLTLHEVLAKKSVNGTVGLTVDENNYLSVIPCMEYDGGALLKILLKPIELGFWKGKEYKGLPFCASKESAERIYNYLMEISKDYGTEYCMNGEYIEVLLEK